ncbi:MAG: glycosyltransferase family 2 protein [Lachnospiraceae bacterium]
MEKILTIVIPSYNAERFLEKGIPSLLDPQINEDIEVVIVDDGSKDGTAVVADHFEECNKGTVKVVHKENGGHGSTINTGIECANGKYFMVVDADDWVQTDHFVEFVGILKNTDCDLFLTDADKVLADGTIVGHELVGKLPNRQIIDADLALVSAKNIEMHNYCIRTSILKDHQIRCHEHCFYVDNEYTMYSLIYVHKVMYINLPVYQYLVGRKGQSISIEQRRKNHKQYVDVAYYIEQYYELHKEEMSAAKKAFICKRIAYHLSGVYSTLMSYRTKERKKELMQFDMELKQSHRDVYDANKNLCVKLLRLTNFALYDLAAFVYCKMNHIVD